jgi:ketosteroid isomerase-like protein
MSTTDTIRKYYEHANAGEWGAWCDLFADDMVMDEQLAGHIEGLATLRPMMDGMDGVYSVFQNVPKHVVVDGEQAAVLSHISARAAQYPNEPIECDVMNYFRVLDGRITYMQNVHDSQPFAPFLRQIEGSEVD